MQLLLQREVLLPAAQEAAYTIDMITVLHLTSAFLALKKTILCWPCWSQQTNLSRTTGSKRGQSQAKHAWALQEEDRLCMHTEAERQSSPVWHF